jgi:hypothetical protein
MARGGVRPGAGRPRKGEASLNAQRAQIDASPEPVAEISVGKTPLEYMLGVMRDPNVDDQRRDRMAMAAAPYVHAKAGEQGKKETAEDRAKKVAKGRFAPPEAPAFQMN